MKKNKFYTKHADKSFTDFADLLNSCAKEYGGKTAYRFLRGKVDYKISYGRFADTVNGLGQALCHLGVNEGHTAIIGEKSFEWLASYFAAITHGGVAVPLDKELAHEQIRGFVNFADCQTVIYSKKYAKVFEGFEEEMPNVKHFIEITMDTPVNPDDTHGAKAPEGNHHTFDQLVRFGCRYINRHGASYDTSVQDVDRMAIIIFTSGTTGTSKGVMLSQWNVISCVTQCVQLIRVEHDDVLVSVLPFHHTYEMTAGILAPFIMGATVCINDSIKNVTKDFKYFQPTIIALVPLFVTTIYKKIMETARKRKIDKVLLGMMKTDRALRKVGIDARKAMFSSVTSVFGGKLNRIVCGGAPMDPDMVEKFASFGIQLTEGYGITECAPVLAAAPFEHVRPGSCGLVLPGVQLYIDRDNAEDEYGEIVVKGSNVMLGYYKNEEATNDVLSDRGWFRTGDYGYIDSDNYLYITGRKKNVIVLNNGKNVFPEEIEEYLEKIELVQECAVLGREADDGTVSIAALIYPDYTRAEEMGIVGEKAVKDYFKKEITALNKRIAGFKQIRDIEIRKNPFPKTTTQKIQRHKIEKED